MSPHPVPHGGRLDGSSSHPAEVSARHASKTISQHANIEAWRTPKRVGGKSRSHGTYGEFLKYQVLPDLGSAAVARITKARIMSWRDQAATKYAPTTVNSALVCLSSAFGYFIDRGWVPSNPCLGVSRIEVQERAYKWIKTRGELEKLLMVCPDELRDMIVVAIATGMRIDEQLHLHWTDVDLERRLITVQRGEQGTVKGGRIRHVPILDVVLDTLKARALKRNGAVLLFPGKAGKVRDKPSVRRGLRAALKRAGLDEKVRWHDLRHYPDCRIIPRRSAFAAVLGEHLPERCLADAG